MSKQPKYTCAEAGIPYPDYKGLPTPQLPRQFELANGEFVSRCHLDLGHKGAHEGWCLGSKCHWPQGFTSEEEVNKALDACIVKTRIEIIGTRKGRLHASQERGATASRGATGMHGREDRAVEA